MRKTVLLLLGIFIFFLDSQAYAAPTVIDSDTEWSGKMTLSSDVLVRKGATLTILPGTQIQILADESAKTEPEYLSALTEITVRGVLRALGTPEAPIRFVMPRAAIPEWGGIFVDYGSISLAWCIIEGAESGITVIHGEAALKQINLNKNRYGLTVLKSAGIVSLEESLVSGNDYGIALLNGAELAEKNNTIQDNGKRDFLRSTAADHNLEKKEFSLADKEKKTTYSNESLLGVVIWKNKVLINGVVRVPAKSRLIIMPGTIIEFSKRDTNNDGIGENGLMIMGMLVAKGTAEQPIIFRSAEEVKRIGDWDSINIYNSDGIQNLLEYCLIEDALRALHTHYSNVVVNHSTLRHNYRGMQFQESLLELRDSDIYDNKSAIRARDAEIKIINNRIFDNYFGPEFFRVTGELRGNTIAGNYLEGLRVREGALDVVNNELIGNRYGMTAAYNIYGNFSSNVVVDNLETGITLIDTDTVVVANNFIRGNGSNGISVQNSRAAIHGNQIAENGERGIGIRSYHGVISNNNLLGNKLYAIDLDGKDDISAPGNWWGDTDIETAVYDRNDDPSKGRLNYEPSLKGSVPFTWPVPQVSADTSWEGEIHVPVKVTINKGVKLTVQPGTIVRFARDRGIWANGDIEAIGEPDNRILFTSLEKTDEIYWHQITTEYATARFAFCDFEYSDMAVHSHFSSVEVSDSLFRKNESGMRFRGGPVKISRSVFVENNFGMVAYFAMASVNDNLFTANDIGIMVRGERNKGLHFRRNNIHANTRYNFRMGDFNNGEDVDALENWWGAGNPADSIYDGRTEPGIGMVLYAPYAPEKFSKEYVQQ